MGAEDDLREGASEGVGDRWDEGGGGGERSEAVEGRLGHTRSSGLRGDMETWNWKRGPIEGQRQGIVRRAGGGVGVRKDESTQAKRRRGGVLRPGGIPPIEVGLCVGC